MLRPQRSRRNIARAVVWRPERSSNGIYLQVPFVGNPRRFRRPGLYQKNDIRRGTTGPRPTIKGKQSG